MKFYQLKISIRTLLRSSALFLLASNAGFSDAGFVDAALATAAQKSSKEIKNIIKRAEISTNYANGSLRLVITSWTKNWECDTFNTCKSRFSGNAKMVRTDGTAVKWNLVESWAQDDCGASPQDNRWFHTDANTDTVYFGWGSKDGKANHASAYLRFTGPDGVATAFVKGNTCP